MFLNYYMKISTVYHDNKATELIEAAFLHKLPLLGTNRLSALKWQ